SGRYRRYVAGQGDPTGLGGDGILNLLRDRQGNLWVGTGWGGLHRLDRTAGRARLLEYNASRPGAFPAHRIMDMTEAPDGAVWAVSDSGLFRLDLRTLTARRHSAPGELLGYGAFVDRDGNLWTTTYPTAEAAARLVRRDARSGRVLDVFPRPNQRPFPSYMIFNAVYRDPTGILWLAMSNVGLLRFDPATGASHQYPVRRSPRAGLSDSLDNGTAYAPVMDRDGMLWVGTSLGGLNRLDPRTGQFRSYFDRAMGIRTPGVILEDRKGRLWFGTYRNGLFMLDRRTGRNTRYTTAQGLAHDFVAGIVEDEAGFLWLNTGGGVSRFDPERRTFRTFGPRDGVPSVGNPHAALGTRSGRIFFSGSNGILVFDPRALSETAAPLMLALETASFRFPSGQDSTRYLYDRQVDVSHDATDVMFTFNGLDYVRPDAVRYQYRLYDGDEPDGVPWTEGGALGLARYTSIPPGRYRFEVRAASADGHWSAPQRVRLVVHPPWWQTGWAYALYALAVAGLLALLVQAVRHRARQRERERLREERERAKDRELAQAKEIEKAYTQLKATQQQLIQQEKLASLGALTAGIAHEIKNPLNFVNNFAQLSRELVEEIKSERGEKPELRVADVEDVLMDLADNVARIEEHGRRADGIVKNMLMHARSGSGRREPTPLNALVEEAANLAYHGMRAQRAGVDVVLETSLDPAVGVVSVVPQEISRVVLNLAGNALYAVAARKERAGGQGDGAAPGESFVPTVRVSTHAVGGAVEIRVWDNGGGIPEAVRAKVFEPFFTTKPAGEGTGLGLSLSHDIVAAHGGALGVESAGGETTFTLTLPTASVPEDVTP
ncbi:MAG TPA: ATP-binding protein, partial [Rhodothermales bacterium]|nr:ATP-binding protein [Rhodothermales bacterium]